MNNPLAALLLECLFLWPWQVASPVAVVSLRGEGNFGGFHLNARRWRWPQSLAGHVALLLTPAKGPALVWESLGRASETHRFRRPATVNQALKPQYAHLRVGMRPWLRAKFGPSQLN